MSSERLNMKWLSC